MEKLRHLTAYKKVYIVGAQSRAKTLTEYLSFLFPDMKIEAYLVDDLKQNASEIQGVPVRKLCREGSWNFDYPVFIATKGMYHAAIGEALSKVGFPIVLPVTVDVDNDFRNAYVEKFFSSKHLLFQKLEQLQSPNFDKKEYKQSCGCIYMAKSVYDKPLESKYEAPCYEKAIQVGAALTKERLEEGILTDCTGDNISLKNRQYCELTALYWVWKHAKEDFVGLAHYRRHFVLPKDWRERVLFHKIDVILPVPTCAEPSISENYRERHTASDWDFLMDYLYRNQRDDYQAAQIVFSGKLYSPCNMFIMRREILQELCAWMFPILDAVAEHGGEKPDTYLNRYPGFISERLITLFFYKNKDRFKIVYADKNFLK